MGAKEMPLSSTLHLETRAKEADYLRGRLFLRLDLTQATLLQPLRLRPKWTLSNVVRAGALLGMFACSHACRLEVLRLKTTHEKKKQKMLLTCSVVESKSDGRRCLCGGGLAMGGAGAGGSGAVVDGKREQLGAVPPPLGR